MSEPEFHLAHPPIVEAVLDIECDFASGHEIKSLEEASRQRLRVSYPKMRTQFLQEFQIDTKAEGDVSHSTRRGIQAFQFLQEDEKQLVQVRAAGYSFNRLAPYSSFDDYLPEIRRTWDLYRDIASPIEIRFVRLRYINRIELPLVGGGVELGEYFAIGPALPAGQGLTCVGFLNQYAAIEQETGHQANVVLTAQRPAQDRLPVIFDNAAVAAKTVDPQDWNQLEATLQSLRNLKNRVFKNSLTDKCLSLFQ